MITNFEGVTQPLSDDERKLVPIIVEGLKKRNKTNPIKGAQICKRINEANLGVTITEARLRKLTNHIRSEGILPVIATSKGYYSSYIIAEIQEQIDSLMDRALAIQNSAEGLKQFLNK